MLFQDEGQAGQLQGLDVGEHRLPPLLILLQQHPFPGQTDDLELLIPDLLSDHGPGLLPGNDVEVGGDAAVHHRFGQAVHRVDEDRIA